MATCLNVQMDSPIFLSNWPRTWPCQKWTFKSLEELLKDKQLSCRVWKKSNTQVFETNCEHINITLGYFCEWLETRTKADNPLHSYNRRDYNCYIDYKYMKEMFESVPEVLDDVKWCAFGLTGFSGKDSTIWIGSEGSNTPCHQDSYGFNLVTQIQGRKMWVLFPPSDAANLYPTRIPYEESSVFSEVDVKNPDFKEHPKFTLCHPVVVILNPGQSLYVPNRWWHYVESLEPSISINVWIPMEQDKHQHVSEAVTRCLATSLIADLDQPEGNFLHSQVLNPTEDLYLSNDNLKLLKTALDKLDSCATLDILGTDFNKGTCEIKDDEYKGGETKQLDYRENITNSSLTVINHLEEFQRWLNCCEIVKDDNTLKLLSKKRKSSLVTYCPRKVLKKESEMKVRGEFSDTSCSNFKLKVYPLNSLPFQEFLSFVQSIFSHGESHFKSFQSHLHQENDNFNQESLPHQTTVLEHLDQCPEKFFLSPDESLEVVPKSDITFNNAELVVSLIKSVLNPSVIQEITVLLKENYFKALRDKRLKTNANSNA